MAVFRVQVLIVFLVTVLLSSSAWAKTAEDVRADQEARALQGQHLIFASDYDAALKLFSELKRDYPESPVGYFGTMATYEIQMLEREDFSQQKVFRAEADRAIAIVARVQQRYNPSPWELFLCGSVLGLDGFNKARRDQWWAAYTAGNKSRQIFKHVKEIDPGFIDADFGLGMYLFWRSVFTQDLWFLRMFPDKRREGIAIVEQVAQRGRFAKTLAEINLAIMSFEMKWYEKAATILDTYVTRYPKNVILRLIYGKALVALKRFDDALIQFRAILALDGSFKKPHYFIGATLVLKKDPALYPEAEKELNAFIKMQGGKYWPASAHYWLGRLAKQRGDNKLAEQEFATAVKLYPKIEASVNKVRGMGGGL